MNNDNFDSSSDTILYEDYCGARDLPLSLVMRSATNNNTGKNSIPTHPRRLSLSGFLSRLLVLRSGLAYWSLLSSVLQETVAFGNVSTAGESSMGPTRVRVMKRGRGRPRKSVVSLQSDHASPNTAQMRECREARVETFRHYIYGITYMHVRAPVPPCTHVQGESSVCLGQDCTSFRFWQCGWFIWMHSREILCKFGTKHHDPGVPKIEEVSVNDHLECGERHRGRSMMKIFRVFFNKRNFYVSQFYTYF